MLCAHIELESFFISSAFFFHPRVILKTKIFRFSLLEKLFVKTDVDKIQIAIGEKILPQCVGVLSQTGPCLA